MQYQSECQMALKSVVKISKPFEKTFMDTMKLFMAIPNRINFLQFGRYGSFSEQTYRNLFKNETFDWFTFNSYIINEHLTGKRKAIAIDPSYIPKSGHKTPWIGTAAILSNAKTNCRRFPTGWFVMHSSPKRPS